MPKLSIQVDETIIKRLDAAVARMAQDPTIQELGVRVNRGLAARAALVRGLRSLESGQGAQTPSQPEPTPDPTPEPTPEPVQESDGVIQPPEGWAAWTPARKFSPNQQVLHDYYGSKGWQRMTGKIGVSTISFYWAPARINQDAAPYPGTDSGGRSIIVQDTPWGPGHIIPPEWGS